MHDHSNEDAYMLCKVLDSMAAQALELKSRIESGKHVPSWADYKIYKAADAIKGALGSTYSMKDHMSHRMPVSIAIQKVAYAPLRVVATRKLVGSPQEALKKADDVKKEVLRNRAVKGAITSADVTAAVLAKIIKNRKRSKK